MSKQPEPCGADVIMCRRKRERVIRGRVAGVSLVRIFKHGFAGRARCGEKRENVTTVCYTLCLFDVSVLLLPARCARCVMPTLAELEAFHAK